MQSQKSCRLSGCIASRHSIFEPERQTERDQKAILSLDADLNRDAICSGRGSLRNLLQIVARFVHLCHSLSFEATYRGYFDAKRPVECDCSRTAQPVIDRRASSAL